MEFSHTIENNLWWRIISLLQKTKLNKKLQNSMLKKPIIVANVYIALIANIEEIINFIKTILEHTCNNNPIVIVGDFNLDILQTSHQQKKLFSFMQNNGFKFHTKKPTT